MSSHETASQMDFLNSVADGSIGQVEPDRGGNWSGDYGLWVDQRFQPHVDSLSPPDRQVVEILGQVALGIGSAYRHQLQDVVDRLMWPGEVFAEDGVERLLRAFESNPSIADPFSVLSSGLRNSTR